MGVRGLVGLVVILLLLAGVARAEPAGDFAEKLKKFLKPGERVAVSYIYESDTGAVTAYGQRWRDRLVSALTERGVKTVPRQDLVLLLEDLETFGDESWDELWKGLSAEVVIVGKYYRWPSLEGYKVELIFKAMRAKPKEVLLTRSYELKLGPGEMVLLTLVKGNLFRRRAEILGRKVLPLAAKLNKSCYFPGEEARITVETRPGVYLYIFNIAADSSVTRIYPNRYFPEKPLASGHFEFPPRGSRKFSLVIRSFPGLEPAYEVFRVVASLKPLKDESFPVPENRVFVGSDAGSFSDLLRLLEGGKVSVVDLPYLVGESCRMATRYE